jgi:hypothetical protein
MTVVAVGAQKPVSPRFSAPPERESAATCMAVTADEVTNRFPSGAGLVDNVGPGQR